MVGVAISRSKAPSRAYLRSLSSPSFCTDRLHGKSPGGVWVAHLSPYESEVWGRVQKPSQPTATFATLHHTACPVRQLLALPETSRIKPESGVKPSAFSFAALRFFHLSGLHAENDFARTSPIQAYRAFPKGYPQRGGQSGQRANPGLKSQAQAELLCCTALHPRKAVQIPSGTIRPFLPGGREGPAGCVRSQSSSMCLHRETLQFSKPFQSRLRSSSRSAPRHPLLQRRQGSGQLKGGNL